MQHSCNSYKDAAWHVLMPSMCLLQFVTKTLNDRYNPLRFERQQNATIELYRLVEDSLSSAAVHIHRAELDSWLGRDSFRYEISNSTAYCGTCKRLSC